MKLKIAGLVAVIALLAGPAWAQMSQPHVQGPGEPDKDKTPAQIEDEKATERPPKGSDKAGAKLAPAKPKTPKSAAKPEMSTKQ